MPSMRSYWEPKPGLRAHQLEIVFHFFEHAFPHQSHGETFAFDVVNRQIPDFADIAGSFVDGEIVQLGLAAATAGCANGDVGFAFAARFFDLDGGAVDVHRSGLDETAFAGSENFSALVGYETAGADRACAVVVQRSERYVDEVEN